MGENLLRPAIFKSGRTQLLEGYPLWVCLIAVSILLGAAVSYIPPALDTQAVLILAITIGVASLVWATPLESSYLWLIPTLVLQNILVIDIGFYMLPAYLVTLLIVVRLPLTSTRIPQRFGMDKPIKLLLLIALLSVPVAALRLSDLPMTEGGGLRYGWLRPLLQLVALGIVAGGYFVMTRSVLTRSVYRQAIRVLILMATLVSVYAVYQQAAYYLTLPRIESLPGVRSTIVAVFPAQGGSVFRSTATFLEPNHLGNFLVGTSLLNLSLLFQNPPMMSRSRLIISFAIQIVALTATFSTAAFLALAIGFLVLLLAVRARVKLLVVLMLCALVAAISAGPLIESLGIGADSGRLLTARATQSISEELIAFEGPFSGTKRVDYWRAAIEMATMYPLTGVGIGNFGFAAIAVHPNLQYSAGSYGVLWGWIGEFGILGGLLFVLFFATMIRAVWSAYKRSERVQTELAGFLAGLSGMMVHYLSSSYTRMEIHLWVLLGLAMAGVGLVQREGSWAPGHIR